MARFAPLSADRIKELTTRRGPSAVDLTEYKDWINSAVSEHNGWGAIELDPSDNVRAIKRRTTIAGKELGRTIKWNRRSTDQELIFQAIDPNTAQRRTRRKKS